MATDGPHGRGLAGRAHVNAGIDATVATALGNEPLWPACMRPSLPTIRDNSGIPDIVSLIVGYSAKSAFAHPGNPSSRRPALSPAIDTQHLARHECAQGPGEHLDDARHLIDGRDAVERAGLDQPVLIDRARSHEAAGAGVAGRDAVDGDVVGRAADRRGSA